MTRPKEPVDPETPTLVAPGTPTRAGTEPVERIVATCGGYELGEVIGRGGMGEVVLARDLEIGRDVALKRMRTASPSTDHVERFLREAKVQAWHLKQLLRRDTVHAWQTRLRRSCASIA